MDAPQMPDQPDAGISREDSLFLYCPYDQKITRHGRRRTDHNIVCTECGNSVEVTAIRHEFTPIARPERAGVELSDASPPRAAHAASWRDDRRPIWTPFAALGVVAAIGLVTLLRIVGNPFSGSSDGSQVAGPQSPTPVDVAGVSVPAKLFVANTGGVGVNLRESPEAEDTVRAWPDGTVLKVIGADKPVNGAMWRNVEDPAGNRGWVPAQYTSS